MLLLRRAARARGSACQRRQGKFPLTPLSARAIFSRRIPAANAYFTTTPLLPASAVFSQHHRSGLRPSRSDPRQTVTAQTATRTARISGLSPSSNPWKSCSACLPRLGRLRRLPSEPWTAFDKDRPSIGRLLNFNSLTPQDSARKTRRDLPPRARKPADYLPGVRKPAGLLSGAPDRGRPPPLSECRFFAPSVRVRLSSMPVNPDASTHTSRVTLRLRQCAAIAVCRLPPSKTPASSAQPAIAAADALAQPQEGHAQANAAGVRPSPVAAEDGVAGFGSGLPSIPASRPLLSRRRRTVTPKVSPQPPSRARCSASPSRKPGCRRRVRQEANALLMRPADGSHRRQEPPARLFDYRRRAGPFRLRRLGFTGVALRAPR